MAAQVALKREEDEVPPHPLDAGLQPSMVVYPGSGAEKISSAPRLASVDGNNNTNTSSLQTLRNDEMYSESKEVSCSQVNGFTEGGFDLLNILNCLKVSRLKSTRN